MTIKAIAAAADLFGYDIVIDGDAMLAYVFMGEAFSHTLEII